MRQNTPPHCRSCLPLLQTYVRSGVVIQEEGLIQHPFWPNPSIRFNPFNVWRYRPELNVTPLF